MPLIFRRCIPFAPLCWRAIDEFELCPRLAGIATDTTVCEEKGCACITGKKAEVALYNKKISKAIKAFANDDTFAIVEQGRNPAEIALVVVDKGVFKRMGYLPRTEFKKERLNAAALESLPLYRENFNIRQIISSYRNNYPERVVEW